MENEIWKDIVGYEGLYQISNFGNVKSLNYRRTKKAKVMIPKINNSGYKWVELSDGRFKKQLLIHRLVAMAFLENPNNYPEVNHKDENTLNNEVDNLEWCTHLYNVRYFFERHKHENIVGRKPIKVLINQLTLDGELIETWDSYLTLNKKFNYKGTSIKECCSGKRKTAYGYKWEFADKNADSLFI